MRATITVLPGDGIGPEVTAEGVRVLRAVAERWGHEFEIREALIGGADAVFLRRMRYKCILHFPRKYSSRPPCRSTISLH